MQKLLFFILLGHASIICCAASSSEPVGSSNIATGPSTQQPGAVITGDLTRTPAVEYKVADINELGGQNGVTLLMLAADRGDSAEVRKLLLQRADPHIKAAAHGGTALMAATMKGHTDAVLTLLALSPDKKRLISAVFPTTNQTALDLAKKHKRDDIVEILTHVRHEIEFGPLCQTYFSPNILDAICQLIRQEQCMISGAMYSFTHGTPAKLLVEKKKAGIPTTLIINKDYGKELCIALNYMINNEIQIYTPRTGSAGDDNPRCFNMHHKFLIFSCNAQGKPLLMTGSCNFTDQAFNRNWENIIVTDNRESIDAYFAELQRAFSVCTKLSAADCVASKDSDCYARSRNCVEDLQ